MLRRQSAPTRAPGYIPANQSALRGAARKLALPDQACAALGLRLSSATPAPVRDADAALNRTHGKPKRKRQNGELPPSNAPRHARYLRLQTCILHACCWHSCLRCAAPDGTHACGSAVAGPADLTRARLISVIFHHSFGILTRFNVPSQSVCPAKPRQLRDAKKQPVAPYMWF